MLHERAFSSQLGLYEYAGHVRHPAVDSYDGWTSDDVINGQMTARRAGDMHG